MPTIESASPSTPVLSRREINRATLARQMLLQRSTMPVIDAVEHLVGLQAQTPLTWYQGLYCRLQDFDPEAVGRLIRERELVRIVLMRSTIHLVSGRDCRRLRPLVQPIIDRSLKGNFGRHLVDIDAEALVSVGTELLEQQPMTFSDLGAALHNRWPDRDGYALAMAVRSWAPLVQIPPRGVWGASGPAAHTTVESWLGLPLNGDYTIDELVLRYLAAFGPASVKDIQLWSGLTRLREVTARLRPRLLCLRDDAGVELFDVPDAPRPSGDVPAPPRFLYDFDNLLLSHSDRSRFLTEEYRRHDFAKSAVTPAIVLVDGMTAGTWQIERRRDRAVLHVRAFTPWSDDETEAVRLEGERLLAFAAAGADADVKITVEG